jgi:hypothetical protein
MFSKRIEIFEKASYYFKKASNSLKISLKCLTFSKKKASRQLPHCHNGQSTPNGHPPSLIYIYFFNDLLKDDGNSRQIAKLSTTINLLQHKR